MLSESSSFSVTHDRTTAVVVAAESDAALLPALLAALAQSTLLPEAVLLAVPTAQLGERAVRDAALTDRVADRVHVVPVGKPANFGAAVKIALARHAQSESTESEQWLWLLHADSVPQPQTFQHLLSKGESSAKIGIVGPKQVAPSSTGNAAGSEADRIAGQSADSAASQAHKSASAVGAVAAGPAVESAADTLSETVPIVREMGIRATRSARRVPEMRDNERDQGQYDAREDVLAVGSAGMLVRREVWDLLAGFNPYLGPFGDGLEFSRRVRLAGYRVVVQPRAVIVHGANSLHPAGELAASFGARRRAQIFNALLAAPAPLLIFLWCGYILAAIPRALMRLLWRDSVRARGELSAGWHAAAMLPAVRAGRKAIAQLQGDPGAVRSLEASNAQVRAAQRALRIAQEEERSVQPPLDPIVAAERRDLRRHTWHGAGLTLILSAVFGVLVQLSQLSSGTLTGGALAIDTSTASDLWAAATHSWLASADGYAGSIDPYWLLFLPFLALGTPWGVTLGQLVTASCYFAAPLGALCAYLAIGRFTKSVSLRTLVALLWIVSPSFLEALASGRSGALGVHVLAPLALFSIVGAWRRQRGQLGLATLVCAILSSAAPILLLGVIVVAITGVIARRAERIGWLWLPIPAILVLIPSLRQLGTSWRAWLAFFFAQPGVPVRSVTDPRRIMAGFTSREFLPLQPNLDWLLFLPLLVILLTAVLTLLRSRVAGTVRLAWLLVLVGMALAMVSAYVPVGVVTHGGKFVPAAAWSGVGFSVAWLGIVTAIGAGANGLRASLRRRAFGPVTIVVTLLGALLPLSMLSIAGYWSYVTFTNSAPLLRSAPAQVVPAIGATNQQSLARSRVLAIVAGADGYTVQEWRSAGWQLHEFTMAKTAREAARLFPLNSAGITPAAKAAASYDAAQADLAHGIAGVASASGTAVRIFGDHAISVVLLPPAGPDTDTQARAALRAYLNGVPGLEYVTENETGAFWRVPAENAGSSGEMPVAVAGDESRQAAADAPARLRIVNSADHTWAGLPAAEYDAQVTLSASDAPGQRYLVLAERADKHWHAELAGAKLTALSAAEARAAGLPAWANAWRLPSGASGTLIVHHGEWTHTILLGLQALAILVSLAAAVPLRSRKEDVA